MRDSRYLATFHKPGIALWGGEKFTKRARFLHSDVKHIEFSPNEESRSTACGPQIVKFLASAPNPHPRLRNGTGAPRSVRRVDNGRDYTCDTEFFVTVYAD